MNTESQLSIDVGTYPTQQPLRYKLTILRDVKWFTRRRMAVFHGTISYIDPEWRIRLGRHNITLEHRWRTPNTGTLVSASEYSHVHKISLNKETSIYIKCYRYSMQEGSRYFLRPSRVAGEVYGLTELDRLRIPTAKIIGFQEQRVLGIPQSAVLITEGITHVANLECYAQDTWQYLPAVRRKQVLEVLQNDIIEKLTAIHKARFFHRDLNWRNILVYPNNIEAGTIWIDPPRARYRYLRKRRGIIADLASLGKLSLSFLTKAERMGFLDHYLQNSGEALECNELHALLERRHQRAKRPPRLISRPKRMLNTL